MADILSAIPWVVLFVVYVGEKLQQWLQAQADNRQQEVLTVALNDALKRAQGAPVQAQVPSSPIQAPVAIPPLVVPAGPFADAPKWFAWALHEIGAHEDPGNRGPIVQRYIDLAHCGAQGDPWCAIFANAALEASGVAGTRSPSSQSFRTHPAFVQLQGPALGCLAVFWRGSPDSGLGHVGFYRGEDGGHVWTLGGNENDMVQIEALPKQSSSFGLIGYWWPKSEPLPTTGAVIMPAGSPVSIQQTPTDAQAAPAAPGAAASSIQTNIIATMFGGPKSAYGGPIDDNKPGVALPFRFEGARPQVEVTNARNAALSTVCDIVDVGPWNDVPGDPYWQTGTRPEAESGKDQRGRKTNGAGIDLTLAAAKAAGIDGKGLVNWRFVETPKVS
ncbi:hypothetical protein [Bradyrhizobium sp.]|uniref:hypothetical protein n=1 Tax=Bradyrhizobium sp. TaxID=376 RepID=UPI0025C45142|nr:hypothetical protein [Bradyrhizobium sp.]